LPVHAGVPTRAGVPAGTSSGDSSARPVGSTRPPRTALPLWGGADPGCQVVGSEPPQVPAWGAAHGGVMWIPLLRLGHFQPGGLRNLFSVEAPARGCVDVATPSRVPVAGADQGARTPTPSRAPVPKTGASANSAKSARSPAGHANVARRGLVVDWIATPTGMAPGGSCLLALCSYQCPSGCGRVADAEPYPRGDAPGAEAPGRTTCVPEEGFEPPGHSAFEAAAYAGSATRACLFHWLPRSCG
jgi:hypothetical protein